MIRRPPRSTRTDTLCPYTTSSDLYCRSVAPVMTEAEAADAQLRIVYKEFPILGPNSLYAAKAALAAHRQGRYVAFHQALMQAEGAADSDRVHPVAAEVGLGVAAPKPHVGEATRLTWYDHHPPPAE